MSKARRQTAAELLAATLQKLFPDTELLNACATEQGFFCEVRPPQSLDSNWIPQIEEALRGAIKAGHPIEQLEMMRENGADYLAHMGQKKRATEALKNPTNIIDIIRIGEYVNLCAGEVLENTAQVGAIKLLNICGNTITGLVASDKKKLKELVKIHKAASKYDHQKCKEIFENSRFFLPEGAQMRAHLLEWYRREMEQIGYLPIITPNGDSRPLLVRLPLPIKVYEWRPVRTLKPGEPGLLGAEETLNDTFNCWCSPDQVEKEVKTLLQFIEKWSKIFNFKIRWIFEKTVKRAFFLDKFGREWEGPELSIDQNGSHVRIFGTNFRSIERILALLLENMGKGDVEKEVLNAN